MRELLGSVLLVTISSIFGQAAAAPVTYNYLGSVTSSFGYPGVNVGDPISILVTYDPTAGPTNFVSFNNGSTQSYLVDYNGTQFGAAWFNWLEMTANFGGYTWENDVMAGFSNQGKVRSILDNRLFNGTYTDEYMPFYVYQDSRDQFGNIVEQRIGQWHIQAYGSTPPSLTNGLEFPQAIDLTMGTQFGLLNSLDPDLGNRHVAFNVSQNGIDLSVPEPTTLALLAIGLAGLGFSRRKQ